MTDELSEELYDLLGELIGRKESLEILKSLRGEYGVLRYLLSVEDNVSAVQLHKSLNVVPGRMADILKSLEKKELISRSRDEHDKRIVRVKITDKGRETAIQKRIDIRKEYRGLYTLLGRHDTEELIRLLHRVMEYYRLTDEQGSTV